MNKIDELAALYIAADHWIDEIDSILFSVVEEGEWEQDHKYQTKETIVQFDGDYFSVVESRSGSYHTDWYYNDTYITPVNRTEEVRTVVSYKASEKGVCVSGKY